MGQHEAEVRASEFNFEAERELNEYFAAGATPGQQFSSAAQVER